MKMSLQRRVAGFTLLEVMVAAALLLMILAGAYTMVSQASSLMRTARDRYLAVNLARNRLERATTFAYGDLPLLAESDVVVDDNGNPSTEGRFSRTTIIDPNAGATNNPPTELTRITVNVGVKSRVTGKFGMMMETMASEYAEP